ncbi:MAG: hypothetical protein SAL07_01700 [Oscillatoria sp. PMC 1051.18]|uniref:hypothetical protein n=1 Tax=Oscillatoria salina TaxID=331517 RepID=UPI0013BA9C8A|nr:hypothetical protein [Oscillatoria salina]MBZ8179886.1 hypothetical protein [Oscillatoria salina IIICB1]MEC4891973.1 hypothetical protein [Oscillatoria sp. PMC 1050.18]MEC5028599.1 hypothetical protein [Oscillatoria sp. PMC 1051.18]NET87433.1 hypothetical protein [Kamptonema sp. SIO1D9]
MANGSSDRHQNQCCCCCGCNRCRGSRDSEGQPWLIFLAFAILMALLTTNGSLQQLLSNQEYPNLPAVEVP